MAITTQLGSQAATTANATLGIACPAGQIWRIVAINIQQPVTGDAKTVSLAIGTTATPVNVKRRFPLTAGVATAQDYPNLVMVAGDQVNIIADGTTAQAVVTVTITKELVS